MLPLIFKPLGPSEFHCCFDELESKFSYKEFTARQSFCRKLRIMFWLSSAHAWANRLVIYNSGWQNFLNSKCMKGRYLCTASRGYFKLLYRTIGRRTGTVFGTKNRGRHAEPVLLVWIHKCDHVPYFAGFNVAQHSNTILTPGEKYYSNAGNRRHGCHRLECHEEN